MAAEQVLEARAAAPKSRMNARSASERSKPSKPAPAPPERAGRLVPEAVVARAPVGVHEHFVGTRSLP